MLSYRNKVLFWSANKMIFEVMHPTSGIKQASEQIMGLTYPSYSVQVPIFSSFSCISLTYSIGNEREKVLCS